LSDSLGNFEISCAHQDKLKITAAGFYSQNVKLDKNIKFAAINLKLKPGDKNLNYAFGLTSVKDRDRLSAMASKTDEDIDFSIYNNMFDAISGRIPGVQIIGGEIIIRGNSTINGTSPALVVVDGVPVHQSQLNAMNPSTVKRINVIKDGSSAIYGSRGANGVVEIETKSGRD
jgi:TonB-dependent SusC/RagA subfamily outer membrane receptor